MITPIPSCPYALGQYRTINGRAGEVIDVWWDARWMVRLRFSQWNAMTYPAESTEAWCGPAVRLVVDNTVSVGR